MFCSKCGNQIEANAKFCNRCGNDLTHLNQNVMQVSQVQNVGTTSYQPVNNNSNNNKNGLALASLIIGIVSVILSIFINIFVIPLAIVGLILGIVNKGKCGKKNVGIILNSASLVISIIIIVLVSLSIFSSTDFWSSLYDSLDYYKNDNYVSGTWDCKSFDGSSPGEEYIVTIKLNKDNTFVWNKYGDEKNNHVYGTYTFVDEEKTNNSGDYKYFMIDLKGEEFVNDGVLQDQEYISQYEMGINNNASEAIMLNVYTYNMYYCWRK